MFYLHFKEICNSHGRSPTAVAIAAGMSKSNVTGWQKGQSPSLDTISKLAVQLGVKTKDLIPDDDINEIPLTGQEGV
ncbi:MAG: helix-turn-helix domain-containing protein [Eubacteriales bacterium]